MKDYISREDALKIAWDEYDAGTPGDIPYRLERLPSADVVEVIRCKECKYFLDPWGCEFLGDGCRVNKKGYCFFAERREE